MFNLATLVTPFLRVRQTSATDNGFPSKVPTKTEPTGVGDSAAQATASAVFHLHAGEARADGRSERNRVLVVPFGVGADDTTFSLRVIGWRKAYDRDKAERDDTAIWVPVKLVEVLCTHCTSVGVAGTIMATTDRFCDTIALTGTTANDDVDVSITSPADNTIGHFALDLKGFQKVEFTFTTGGSATAGNALVGMY